MELSPQTWKTRCWHHQWRANSHFRVSVLIIHQLLCRTHSHFGNSDNEDFLAIGALNYGLFTRDDTHSSEHYDHKDRFRMLMLHFIHSFGRMSQPNGRCTEVLSPILSAMRGSILARLQ